MGSPVAFYFSGHPNFAANQLVTIMEIITFESKAYKELDNKITAIADYIFNHVEKAKQSEEDMWVDSYEVCTFLKISEKTLQRLRVSGTIAYSNIRGRYFYKVSEIRRMLEERLIRSNKENIDYNRGIQMYRFPNSDVQKSVIFEGIKKRLKIV